MSSQESIEAADKYGMAMVFTGVRHFRHWSNKAHINGWVPFLLV